MKSASRPCLTVVGALLGLAGLSAAQNTFCVNTTTCPPGGFVIPFPDIAWATSVAGPGDTIIVGPGTYPPFAVLSQNLTIQPENFGGTFTVDAALPPILLPPQVTSGRGVEIIGPGTTGAFIDGMEVVNGLSPSQGGGVFISGSDPTLSRAVVRNNSAVQGGGIAIEGDSPAGNSPTIQNSEIYENEATNGGGIHITDSGPTIAATEIYRNGLTTPALDGGGVWTNNSGPYFQSCDIYENFALDRGGGVYAQADFTGAEQREMVFEDSRVHDNATDTNFAGSAGGGIYATGGLAEGAPNPMALTISSTEIYDNDSYDGGGLCTNDFLGLSVDYGRFDDNTAANDGGGAYVDFAPGDVVTNSQFSGNSADRDGGGIYLGGSSDIGIIPIQTMINCLVVGNSARDGAGIWVAADLNLITSTVDMNMATRDGGGLFLASSGSVGSDLSNSIFYNNTSSATDYTKGIFNAAGTLMTSYLCWDNGTVPMGTPPPCTGPGCFNAIPGYASGPGVPAWQTQTTYYLNQGTSPCIGTGDPAINVTIPPYVTATTDPLHVPDVAPVDVGFHFNGVPLPTPTSTMVASAGTFSVGAGGSITFSMTAPVTAGPSTWVFGGSATGTYPGFFFSGVVVPLVFDSYSQLILNGGVLPNSGPLSPTGTGTTVFSFGAGALPPGLVGATYFHAFLVLDPLLARDASNPVPLTFMP